MHSIITRQKRQLKEKASAFNYYFDHAISHEIVFKAFQLKLQDRGKINEENTLPSILKRQKELSIQAQVTNKQIKTCK